MARISKVLVLLLALVFTTAGIAGLTPEKAAYLDAVDQAKALLEAGADLTPDQVSLLEDEGIIRNERNELDRLGGPDDFGYSFADSNEPNGPDYEWVEISETGTEIPHWGDDINLGPFDIGFDFPFYGETYTQFWVCSNGWLTFSDGMGTTYTNRTLPDATTPNNAIYWSWDDWTPVDADVAWYGLDDDGNCVFQCGFAVDGPGTLDSEVILYPDGTIKLQYGPDFSIRDNSSTIGLENQDGTIGLEVVFNDNVAYPSPEMAIQFELLDMGTVSGIVFDNESLETIAGAEVTLLLGDNFYRSTFTDENGHYSMMVEIGDYDIFADAFAYIASTPQAVTIILDDNVTVNIGLDREPAPQIVVDPEALNFVCEWMGTDSNVLTITNVGGVNLDWYGRIEYVEDEEMGQLQSEAKPMPNHFQIPTNIVLPAQEDLVGATEEKIDFYENVQSAFNALKNNIPLKREQRDLLVAEGILPNHDRELDMTGEDEFGYILTDSEEPDCPDFEWIDISETGTEITNWSDDTNIGPFELGFEFPFYGELYTEFWLCSNGFMTFSSGQGTTYTNRTIPDATVPNNAIYWCWDDWRPDPGDFAWYGMDADGNFVVQFAWVNDNFAGVIDSEIILYPNGAIKIQYGPDFVVRDNNITIGLENVDGSIGLEAVFNNNVGYPAPETVILFHLGEYTGGWAGLDPSHGTIAPQAQQEVIVSVDASMGDLDPGTYEAIITIATDYPNVLPVNVWATLTVEDPGTIAGQVYDDATMEGIPFAGVYILLGDEWTEYICDEEGNYTFPVGEGTYEIYANANNYYPHDQIQVTVVDGEIEEQNFGLTQEVVAEIVVPDIVLEEGLTFEINWGEIETQIVDLTNTGGLDLNFNTYIQFIEDEEMAGQDFRNRVQENYRRTMPDPRVQMTFEGSTEDYIAYPSTPCAERYCELDDPYFLLVQDTNPWGYTSNLEVLEELEIPFDLVNSATLSGMEFDEYTVIMCAGLQNATYYQNLAANYEAIVEFIESGGWFQFCGSQGSAWTLWDGTHSQTGNYDNNFILEPDHPMLVDMPDPIVGNSANHGSIAGYPEEALVLVEDEAGNATVLEYQLGRGNVLLSTQTWEFYWNNGQGDNHPGEVLRRACAYTAEARGTGGWLTIEPPEGVVAPDETLPLAFTVDAVPDMLLDGTYEALVDIVGEHELVVPVQIWVTLIVHGGPPQDHFVGTEDLPLNTNYFELISTYLDPSRFPSDAEDLFGPIPGLSIAYQSDGGNYIPGVNNSIGDIDPTQGYRLFLAPVVDEIQTVHIQGDMLDPMLTEYNITGNIWNWIGYPFDYEIPVETALATIVDDLRIIMNDEGHFWIPGVINTLGTMTPGEGYMIITSSDLNLVYNAPVMATPMASDVWTIPEVEDAPQATGLPYPVLVELSDEVNALQPATIEIYDGKLLVAKAVVMDDRDFTPVIAWEGSEIHDVPGFVSGNQMSIVVKAANGSIIPTTVENAPLFGEGAYASVNVGGNAVPTEFTVNHAYPNPFNPSVTVPFALPTAGEVNFTVFNVLGQQVMNSTNKYEVGHHRFIFNVGNDLVSGVYFLQVQYNSQINTQKLMLLK